MDRVSTQFHLFLQRLSFTFSCAQRLYRIQESLKKKLITEDRFSWKLPSMEGQYSEGTEENQASYSGEILKYVGGVDLSFSKTDPSIACATLAVLDISTLEVVHEVSTIVKLRIPYVPGFLAFREVKFLVLILLFRDWFMGYFKTNKNLDILQRIALHMNFLLLVWLVWWNKLFCFLFLFLVICFQAPVLLELLEKMKKTTVSLYPQVIPVDIYLLLFLTIQAYELFISEFAEFNYMTGDAHTRAYYCFSRSLVFFTVNIHIWYLHCWILLCIYLEPVSYVTGFDGWWQRSASSPRQVCLQSSNDLFALHDGID